MAGSSEKIELLSKMVSVYAARGESPVRGKVVAVDRELGIFELAVPGKRYPNDTTQVVFSFATVLQITVETEASP